MVQSKAVFGFLNLTINISTAINLKMALWYNFKNK